MPGKRVIIVGMGFGGLSAAKALCGKGFELCMVDRHNFHLFQPLLYQVATAGLEQEAIAYPLRAISRKWKNAEFLLAEIGSVDLENRFVLTRTGKIAYDYLIVAAGSRTNFFGMKSVEQHSFDLKRLDQAEDLRNQILLMFEKASQETDPKRRSALLTFVVVGGGPTGVEFSGALRELILYVLSKDHPNISPDETRTMLVEAADSLLTAMPSDLREYACNKLRGMGVEVLLNTKVVDATAETVALHDGTIINCHTLFWSAGVAAAGLASGLPGVELAGSGRVVVQTDLSLKGFPEVFVIGDMASFVQDGSPLPMMAPVASQQGRYAARAIMSRESGGRIPPFRYLDKGAMATIGRSSAVAITNGFKFRGYPAWLVWLVLHLFYLIGFRNRLVVMMNWAHYYFSHERQVRLITADKRRSQS